MANYVTVQGLYFDNNAEACVGVHGQYAVIQDNEMTACGAGVESRADYTTISHNNIHDLITAVYGNGAYWGGDGVMLNGSSHDRVDYNTCTNCTSAGYTYSTADGGFVEFYSSNTDDMIDHNYVLDSWQISQIGSQGGTDSNITWADNLFVNSGPLLDLHLSGTWVTTVTGFQVLNNTYVANSTAWGNWIFETDTANSVGFTASDLVVRNNIFYIYNGAKFGGNWNGSNAFTHDHNIWYGVAYYMPTLTGSESTADPQLVSPNTGNYALMSTSPAIGAALAPAPFSTD